MVSLFATGSANAQGSANAHQTDSQDAGARSASRFVLLGNGNVLEGDVSELGHTVYLTHADRSVIRLSRDQVKCIGQSLEDLYEYRCRNRFESDLRGLLADVRWCLRNGLLKQAAKDVLTARTLDPSNPETYQLLRVVRSRLEAELTPANDPAKIQRVSFEMPDSEAAAVSEPETPSRAERFPGIDEAVFNQFATRVQPILMNRCVRCHAKDDDNSREFQIHTALTSKWAPDIVAEENLQQVLRYVDRFSPQSSPLRERATDGHGGRRFSFGKPGSSMMVQLDQWLMNLSTSRTSSARSQARFVAAAETRADEDAQGSVFLRDESEVGANSGAANGPSESEPSVAPMAQASESPVWKGGDASQQIRRMPKVDNPFDPEIFNRRFHRQ